MVSKAPSLHSSQRQQGFSLIEVILVISLAALMFVMVIPNLSISEETDAQQKLGALAGDIRSAFDTAVLLRKPLRLAFTFETGEYWLESTESESFYLGDEKEDRDLSPQEVKDRRAIFDEEFEQYKVLAGKEVEDAEEEKTIPATSPLLAAKDKLAPPEWNKVEDAEWGTRSLGPRFRIRSMQAEHHGRLQTFEELGKEAIGYLYFFPHGYVERAVIHIQPQELEDNNKLDEKTYTITTEPYEGVAEVRAGYHEVDVSRDKRNP